MSDGVSVLSVASKALHRGKALENSTLVVLRNDDGGGSGNIRTPINMAQLSKDECGRLTVTVSLGT